MTTIIESDNFKITYNQFNESSDTTVVSFGHIRSDIESSGFGTDLCRNLGFNNIYVAQRIGTQYQGLDIDTFYKETSPYLCGKKTYSYGSSLGGYAALYFGGCIDAKIIASAPINHAHKSISDPEFKSLVYNHVDIRENRLSKLSPIILFDPHQQLDVKFITQCVRPAYPDATYISYPFAGHTILETMKENGVLSKFVRGIFFDGSIENLGMKQDGCPIYHAEVGRKLRYEGDMASAERELLKSINLKPTENAFGHLLWVYIETSNVSGIISAISTLLSEENNSKISKYIPKHVRPRLKKIGIDIEEILKHTRSST